MVCMGAQRIGGRGFYSLLRHFFKNSIQHLAHPGPPGGQTVRHHFPTSTKPVDNSLGGQTVGGENNHESKYSYSAVNLLEKI